MRWTYRTVLVVAMAVLAWPLLTRQEADAWGFYAHKRINRMALR